MRMKIRANQYHPDIVSPPGETLLEIMQAIGMSQAELAARSGRPKKTINEIIKGKAALTPETALQMERVLGVPASFWNNREVHYREFLARRGEDQRLKSHQDWLQGLPLSDMIELGWIEKRPTKVAQLQEVLSFFGVTSPAILNRHYFGPKVAFRKSKVFKNDPALLAAWLRVGEMKARRTECAPYKAERFRLALAQVRDLLAEPPQVFQPRMIALLAQAGVALVFVQEPPRLCITGATRWITKSKALIQMSLRFTTDDQFWLTFFHEAGHILQHGKRLVFINAEDSEDAREEEAIREEEANLFAADFLVPPEARSRFAAEAEKKPSSAQAVRALALELKLPPGVALGVLQNRGAVCHSEMNDLKTLFKPGLS